MIRSCGARWAAPGGSVREGAVPPARGCSTRTNPSRSREIVRDINKFSNNVMARQLYLTLGAEIARRRRRAPRTPLASIAQLARRKKASRRPSS